MIITDLELVVDRGATMSFDRLPFLLRVAVEANQEFPAATSGVWRHIAVTSEFLGEVVGTAQIVVQVRREQRPQPLVDCQSFLSGPDTETLTLTRLYDGHIPTRYLVGRCATTGEYFWTE